jgi:hypothetical protein
MVKVNSIIKLMVTLIKFVGDFNWVFPVIKIQTQNYVVIIDESESRG